MLSGKQQLQIWCCLFAVFFIWVSYRLIRDVYRCKVKTFAVCTKINDYYCGRGSHSYAPVFKYSYQGKEYEKQTPQSFRKNDCFQPGQTYTVYLWEKKPNHVIYRNKVRFFDVFLGIMGLLFLIIAICV